MADDRDHDRDLRQAAIDRALQLRHQYDELVPLAALSEGFQFRGERVSFGSFFSGIFRPQQMHGPAALALVTAPPKVGKRAPYEDTIDEATGEFTYRFRDARSDSVNARLQAERDNRTLIAAHELAVPLIYFRGILPGQYMPIAPVFVTRLDVAARTAWLEVGLPAEVIAIEGGIRTHDARRYVTREVAQRLHQQRFRTAVLQAYRTRCAVCSLKEATLLQAAHIIDDRRPDGHATVENGVALCAIHHLAYDRNLMGIDPAGVVHIHHRLLHEIDGPMLKNGLQHFHGAAILQPARKSERPDPDRLEVRFAEFRAAALGHDKARSVARFAPQIAPHRSIAVRRRTPGSCPTAQRGPRTGGFAPPLALASEHRTGRGRASTHRGRAIRRSARHRRARGSR